MKTVSIKVLVPIKDVISALGSQHELVPRPVVMSARKVSTDTATAAFMAAAQSLSDAYERLDEVRYTRDERRAMEAVIKAAGTVRNTFRTMKQKERTNGI